MTNDTSYREKGRAVFLAAIMVLSMVAGAAALAGSVAASHDPGPEEVSIDNLDGDRYWQGQTINITNLDGNEDVDVYDSDGNLIRERQASGGFLEISTANLEDGDYVIEPLGNSSSANISITTQQFYDASFASSSTSQGTVDLTLDSNRRGYNVTISADGLTASDLDGVFNDTPTEVVHSDSDAGTITVHAPDGVQTYSANFSAVDAGDYTFNFDVVDTTASTSANITVSDAAGEDVTFGSQSYSGVVGDEMEIDLQLTGGSTDAWINVSDDEGFYNAAFNLTGVSEDTENVTLTWNTHQATNETANFGFTASDGDVENVSHSGDAFNELHLLNRQASFTFESFRADPTESEFRDVAAVQLNTRSTGATSVWTAPTSVAHDGGNITAIIDQATQDSTIASGDLLIAQVEATGLYGYTDENAVDFNSNGLNLTFTQTDVGPYSTADSVNVSTLDQASVYTQPDEGQFFVVVDTANHANLTADSSWDVNFTVGENNAYIQSSDDEENTGASLSVEESSLEITGEFNDNDALTLPATEDAEVTAESNVAPGTEVNVRMNFPFQFVTASGEVGDDGTVATTVDLSGFEEGTQFSARVGLAGGSITEDTDGVVGAGEPASFGVSANAPGSVAQDEQAQLAYSFNNEGGENGTVNYTVTVGGEEVDSGSVDLDAGASSDPMSYEFDTSSAGDVEWEVSTQHDSQTGTLTVEGGNDTTGDDTTGDDTTGDDTTTDDGGDDGGDDGDGGQPGFGLIVALFALIGAALLALRRQN